MRGDVGGLLPVLLASLVALSACSSPDAGRDGTSAADSGAHHSDGAVLDASNDDDAGSSSMRDTGVALDATASDAAADGGEPSPPPPKPAVVFDPPGGGFATGTPLAVTLSPGIDGQQVHCTTDGTEPTLSSPLCDAAPLSITTTTLVRAVAVSNGIASVALQHLYVEVATDAQGFSSNLPVIVVHMLGAAAPDPASREYVSAAIAVFDPTTGRTSLLDDAAHTSKMGIKVRGRSTRWQAKHSYTLELWKNDQDENALPLLGMPADADWVLYAPYQYDRSLMHNALAYAWSNQVGAYAPRTRFCEAYVVTGGSALTQSAYNGVYVLTERISRGSQRVNVAKLAMTDVTEPNVTGGYIFAQDEPDGPNETFHGANQDFVWIYPKPTEVATEQATYLSAHMDAFARAVSAPNGIDTTTGLHYDALIDVNAFIDHHIVNVFAKNPDAFALSGFFHKDRSGKVAAGPVWDFDLAMGGHDPWGERSLNPSIWGPSAGDTFFERGFYAALFTHAEFASAYWSRWSAALTSTFNVTNVDATVDAFAAELAEAEARNRARWPEAAPIDASNQVIPYIEEVSTLKTWLHARLTFVAANQGVLP